MSDASSGDPSVGAVPAGAVPEGPAVPDADDGGGSAGLRRVSVSDVRVAVPATPGVEAGMVTLREDQPPYRAVSIVIGQPEARAIQAAWTGQTVRRPSTWDLFVSAVGALDGRLDRAVITSVEERRHFFADIEVSRTGRGDVGVGDGTGVGVGSVVERLVLPARPSDAVALALRSFGAELYVAEQVFVDLGLGEPPADN